MAEKAKTKTTVKPKTVATKKPVAKKAPAKKVAPKNKSLGRGLDLIYDGDLMSTIAEINSITINEAHSKGIEVIEIDLKKLQANPYQPRQTFDEESLKELSDSIKVNGVFTPILIKQTPDNNYYIIAGERRARASKLAGKTTVPAIISKMNDSSMQTITLIENMQREELNPIEEAFAIDKLIKKQKITQEKAAKMIGKSRSYIANSVRLLNSDKKIIDAVLKGDITYGHARPLIGMEQSYIRETLKRILESELSVREVENIAKAYKLRAAKASKKPVSIKKDQELEYAEDLFRNKLRTKVEVTNNKVIIKYRGKEQLNRILERMDAIEK